MSKLKHFTNPWLALVILCLGDLMIVLDTTIVNVALPSIKTSLHFSELSLVWVVNAYMLTFGGFLLLGGRLGDLWGQRRIFLAGIGLFTFASLLCGTAQTQLMLIGARTLQGIGGAIVSAVALAIIMALFSEASERAKAMGIFGFVASGGGALGVLLGGLLTNALDWHWIFLVNLPIGIIVTILTFLFLPKDAKVRESVKLDIAGAITVTSGLMLLVYAIINGNTVGWLSAKTLMTTVTAFLLLLTFLRIESKTKQPLMPLHLFRIRSVAICNIIGIAWAAAMFAWFFISALYLQIILHYSPMQVGLAFLPANLIMAIFSLGISAKVVMRFGISRSLATGLGIASLGLIVLARAPIDGNFWLHVFPCMAFLGLGAAIAFNPMLLGAMAEVPPHESGVASGLVNTAFMMGGSVGLAILASLASYQTKIALLAGKSTAVAINSGYHTAFIVGAGFAIIAALLALTLGKLKIGGSASH